MGQDKTDALTSQLERDLNERYGPMVSGDDLRKVLGFTSMEAMRQALARRQISLPVFTPENRRGKFALSHDVARWLASQRQAVIEDQKPPKQGLLDKE
ncbi:hypothetical protein LH425_14815 [Laribacter hongkongensis]|uniref:hypothetical protein n=1 Tax=Laribacter hongkongensis TaxID=168471 RepID=UPI001EFCDB69|nr:hypothetical protein [Laribacter hongkongensis]MCG9066265.1 hypothetical protein [Laribacter hongkongensis]